MTGSTGASLVSPTPQRALAVTLSTEDTITEEPPDLDSLNLNGFLPAKAQRISNASSHNGVDVGQLTPPASSSPFFSTHGLASSLDSTFRRAYADRKASPIIPHSPSIAESVGGSASDYDNEHEPDSPSSLSSWNSWAGGRRGDLADVEDLELDGITAIEPELETVSELDEDSSAFMSGSDRPAGESDDEQSRSSPRHHTNSVTASPVVGEHYTRRRHLIHGVPHPHHPHYQHHASHLHPHGVPVHPHFSPRAGGHGLSHASRHLLRAPPNLAARRRKGRLAELAEEGVGSISSTKMPQEYEKPERKSSSQEYAQSLPTSLAVPNSPSNTSPGEIGSGNNSPPDAGLQSNIELEIFGPPALPVRSVSPSETVPFVPSPLCVCLTADEQGEMMEINNDATPTREIAEAEARDPRQNLDTSTPVPPSPTASGRSVDTFAATASTPPTSPPTSPQLGRKGSLRSRRASSPGRSKSKLPLRPCFKRRSAEKNSNVQGTRTPDSSSDHSRPSPRGRTKVRFSQAPPMEVRTHSPVEYDRKACPVSNRLSPEDLEELRLMKMEMGLLEAKCAALAACKPETNLRGSHSFNYGPTEPASSDSESENHHGSFIADQRRRADSVSSSSPTTSCGDRFSTRADSKCRMTPAEYLRMEREKERERVCRMAGIGTGVGFRYSGNPNTRQMPHGGCETFGASSLINRFGLSKPPPPLPGLCAPLNASHSLHNVSQDIPQSYNSASGYEGGTGLYRPNSAPPVRGSTMDYGHATSAFPQMQVQDKGDEQPPHELEGIAEEPLRGRKLEKGSGNRFANPSSTSTDATLTEADVNAMRAHIPHLTRTRASLSPTSPGNYQDRTRSLSPSVSRFIQPEYKPIRPGIYPVVNSHSSPSYELLPTPPSTAGYDSPASEFCYESGSEYDLCG